jgi:myo-inositol-1(or 4)-monophosphatase
MMDDFDSYMRVCREAVLAGARVVQSWIGRTEVREKGRADLVTQADLGSQETVRQIVLDAFPHHTLLGEESPQCTPHAPREAAGTCTPHTPREGTEYRWIVDPLDGTTNYVHGLPHYCVSLALERRGELLVGAVYDPCLDECFTAIKGRGAWLNGRPIRVSQIGALSGAVAAAGFPPDVRPEASDLLMFLDMLPRCQAVRRTGSAALNLCYLAAGRFDLFWSYSTRVWDVAAGALMVSEAGGLITSPTGGPFRLDEAHFLAAATPQLHAELLQAGLHIGQGADR